MQSLDYKLKTSNTNYVTARHDVQYFPSSLSSFSPATEGLPSADPESIKIAETRTPPTRWPLRTQPV